MTLSDADARDRARRIDEQLAALLVERLDVCGSDGPDLTPTDEALRAVCEGDVGDAIREAARKILEVVEDQCLDLRMAALGMAPVQTDGHGYPSLREEVLAADREERSGIVERIVEREVRDLTGSSAPGGFDVHAAFSDLGLDSLTGGLLRRRLEDESALVLETTLVFDHPTPAAVAREIAGRLVVSGTAAEVDRLCSSLSERERNDVLRRLGAPAASDPTSGPSGDDLLDLVEAELGPKDS